MEDDTAKEDMTETDTTMMTDALTYPAVTEACPITIADIVPMKYPIVPGIRREASRMIESIIVRRMISIKDGKGTSSLPLAIFCARLSGTMM